MVKITVSKSGAQKTFQVYKGLLSFYSGWFDRALNGKTTIVVRNTIKLTDAMPKTFESVQYWLYCQRFAPDTGVNETKALSHDDLYELWLFGQQYEVPWLQNAAINRLVDKVADEWTLPIDRVGFVYEVTPAGCPLRRFVVDTIARTMDKERAMETIRLSWPIDAVLDVLSQVWSSKLELLSQASFAQIERCQYHVHEEGVSCKKSGVPK